MVQASRTSTASSDTLHAQLCCSGCCNAAQSHACFSSQLLHSILTLCRMIVLKTYHVLSQKLRRCDTRHRIERSC